MTAFHILIFRLPFQPLYKHMPYALFGLLSAALTYYTYKITTANPHLRGSGLPQTKKCIEGSYAANPKRDIPLKAFLIVLLNDFGYSIGSTGPAFILGSFMSEWFIERYQIDKSERSAILPVYGCAAVGAFLGVPFASIALASEEFSIFNKPKLLLKLFYVLFISQLTIEMINAQTSSAILPFNSDIALTDLPANFLYLLPLACLCVCLGYYYKKLLFLLQAKYARSFSFVIAYIALIVLTIYEPLSITGGFSTLKAVIGHHPIMLISLLIAFVSKYLFTVQCASTGMPAGIFFPSLCLGGLIGAIYTQILTFMNFGPINQDLMILAGMALLFTSILGLPLTGCFIACEITHSLPMVIVLIPIAVVFQFIQRKFGDKSLTEQLLDRMN